MVARARLTNTQAFRRILFEGLQPQARIRSAGQAPARPTATRSSSASATRPWTSREPLADLHCSRLLLFRRRPTGTRTPASARLRGRSGYSHRSASKPLPRSSGRDWRGLRTSGSGRRRFSTPVARERSRRASAQSERAISAAGSRSASAGSPGTRGAPSPTRVWGFHSWPRRGTSGACSQRAIKRC
jgi:hypothetical protein